MIDADVCSKSIFKAVYSGECFLREGFMVAEMRSYGGEGRFPD
jgi:hypothetical protein